MRRQHIYLLHTPVNSLWFNRQEFGLAALWEAGHAPKILPITTRSPSRHLFSLDRESSTAQGRCDIHAGFRQEDVDAPRLFRLFNLYIGAVNWCLRPLIMQSGIELVDTVDGQLRECKSRVMQDIAWVLMYADDIALITETEEQMHTALTWCWPNALCQGAKLRVSIGSSIWTSFHAQTMHQRSRARTQWAELVKPFIRWADCGRMPIWQ